MLVGPLEGLRVAGFVVGPVLGRRELRMLMGPLEGLLVAGFVVNPVLG